MGRVNFSELQEIELLKILQTEKSDLAFEEIYKRYYKMVYNYFKRYVYYLPDTIIEELSDDVFMQVYLHIEKLKNLSGFKRWVFQISHNACVNYLQRKYKKNLNDFPLERIPDQRINLEEDYISRELQEHVLNEVSCLDDKQRELIIMKFFQNLTYEEISEITRISVRKLKYELKKILIALHDKIKGKGFN